MEKTVTFFFICLISKVKPTPVSLYTPADNIKILDVSNFKEKVENSTSAWLVEFYASWCGDCQRFAPKWKDFANDVLDWRDIVQVGAVACSDEINTPLCREMGIFKYPTVKYFHENYQVSSSNVGVDLVHDDDTDPSIKEKVLEYLIREVHEGRRNNYPNLLPYNHEHLEHLYDDAADNVEFIFLVIADTGYLGAELALDLHKIPAVAVRYSSVNNSVLKTNLGIENYPTILVLDKNNKSEIFKNATTSDEIKSTVSDFLQSKGINLEMHLSEDNTTSNNTDLHLDRLPVTLLRQHIKKMGDVVFQADLEAALRYSLQQEVSSVEVIKDEKLKTLKDYLSVINKYFPFGYRSSSLISLLINVTSQAKEVRGIQIQDLVKEAEENNLFSSPRRFIGCLGSSPSFRGYPCSLWTLFHYLTVNFADANADNRNVNPREVLETVHSYVKNFFGCKACSLHFQEMATKRNMTNVSSLEDSVLWLWESHNVVNERLKGDPTEDPEYQKVQFPTRHNCPECYAEYGFWERSQVLAYLKRMYGRFNVRYIGSDTSVIFPGLD
ncbi:hypothetical protein Zmor_005518 [Zophobas morio]|uniref:Sulfhydryl oxidase n=1 Tax=Zophobas morio TaxID=2755281 RepID=A0AA38MMJ2_9CUCU|nr:hypothetical protein Zmor_005518 [Zophobas morio]